MFATTTSNVAVDVGRPSVSSTSIRSATPFSAGIGRGGGDRVGGDVDGAHRTGARQRRDDRQHAGPASDVEHRDRRVAAVDATAEFVDAARGR